MKVGMIVRGRSQKRDYCDYYFPICSRYVLDKFWRPACSRLNLRRLRNFEKGVEVRKSRIPRLVEELARLKEYMLEHLTDPRFREALLFRVEALIGELRKLKCVPGIRITIGPSDEEATRWARSCRDIAL